MNGRRRARRMHVAVVRFEVKPDRVEDFRAAVEQHAATALAREPGCRQFDVCIDATSPGHVLTYEVFDDEAAFKAHLESPHMAEFRAKVKDMVAARRVEGYRIVSSPPPKR